nr:MAG TPA: hypothetical protein [Caudoviricetes sp.]DAT01786.1 MAG TPA: hypothetical protein [Caudoviricetes sp.]DAX60540.1 MAG TPA: hypothetical protein [Caudoviricetes sp.]
MRHFATKCDGMRQSETERNTNFVLVLRYQENQVG